MDWSILFSTFGLVFVAELGDKTQLAVVTQACKHRRPLAVFVGASLALTLVTALGVIGGQVLGSLVSPSVLEKIAALAFVVMGGWVAVEAARFKDSASTAMACDPAVDEDEDAPSMLASAWDWKAFSSTFGLLFIAELGDKTQLAVLSLAGKHTTMSWSVFIGGAMALTAVTALGAVGGRALCALVPERPLLWISALAFVVMGVLMGIGVL